MSVSTRLMKSNLKSFYNVKINFRERDFRNSYGQKNEYEYSEDFWEVLVARLVFVVCFEVNELNLEKKRVV